MISVAVVLIGGVVIVLAKTVLNDSPNVDESEPQTENIQQNEPGEQVTQTDKSSSKSRTESPGAAQSNQPPQQPYGDFVSNHHPNLDGNPVPNRMSSVCNTSPGATCTVRFTKNGVTKELPVKKSDDNGAVYWDWNLQDIGLSEGNWTIRALATLNGKTTTATDPLNLEVEP